MREACNFHHRYTSTMTDKMREKNPLALLTVSRIAVCGGSLTNELSGVYLVRQRPKRKTKVEEDDHVSVVTVMYNPRSTKSPMSPESMDLVFDLHNTTANMGLCLIAYSDCDWIFLHIYRYLQGIRANDPHQILKEEMESDGVCNAFSHWSKDGFGTEPLYPFFINECAQRSVGIPSIWPTNNAFVAKHLKIGSKNN
uniref:Uncharacterized protein n=1 Tax=Oncorhynchus kisutch TaxID=8019 RepID=A0A8C7MSM5_ONCKI